MEPGSMAIDDAAFPLNPLRKRMRVSRLDQAASQHRASMRSKAIFHTETYIHVSKYPHRAGHGRMPILVRVADSIAQNRLFYRLFCFASKSFDFPRMVRRKKRTPSRRHRASGFDIFNASRNAMPRNAQHQENARAKKAPARAGASILAGRHRMTSLLDVIARHHRETSSSSVRT
jgi:hypothetical protein